MGEEPGWRDPVDKEDVIPSMNDSGNECPICLAKIDDSTARVRLRCSHNFHTDCIIESLRHNGRCPLCRDKGYDVPEAKNYDDIMAELYLNNNDDDDDEGGEIPPLVDAQRPERSVSLNDPRDFIRFEINGQIRSQRDIEREDLLRGLCCGALIFASFIVMSGSYDILKYLTFAAYNRWF